MSRIVARRLLASNVLRQWSSDCVKERDILICRSWLSTRRLTCSLHRDAARLQSCSDVNLCLTNRELLQRSSGVLTTCVRNMSKKRKPTKASQTDSDDDEDDDDLDDDSDDEAAEQKDTDFEEETDAPSNYRFMKVQVPSTRADTVLAKGLNISKNKVIEQFFASKLLLNDEKLLKKNKLMAPDDVLDLIVESDTEGKKVKRVKLLAIQKSKTSTNKVSILIRAWRGPFSVVDSSGAESDE